VLDQGALAFLLFINSRKNGQARTKQLCLSRGAAFFF